MATKLDLADAQFLGWGCARKDDGNIIRLVESMGLTKKEWIKWKKNYPNYPLEDDEVKQIDDHFNLSFKERM